MAWSTVKVCRDGRRVGCEAEHPQIEGVALQRASPGCAAVPRSPPGLAATAGSGRSGSAVCRAISCVLPQPGQVLGVALLDGGQQRRRPASAPPTHSSRAFWMSSGARTGLTGWLSPLTTLPMSSPAAAAATSIPGSMGGSNSGISWTWPCDVLAVADLCQPVLDGVPVAEQLGVGRDAEVQRLPGPEHRGRSPSIADRRGGDVERELALQRDERVAHARSSPALLQVVVALGRTWCRPAGLAGAAGRAGWRPARSTSVASLTVSIVIWENRLSPQAMRLSRYFITT